MNNEEKILSLLENLDTRMGNIETRMGGIETRMDGMETRMDGMEKQMHVMQVELHDTNEYMVRMDARLGLVESTVVRIENDHGAKLDALMDGYKQNTEMLERVQAEVTRHEEVILRRIK